MPLLLRLALALPCSVLLAVVSDGMALAGPLAADKQPAADRAPKAKRGVQVAAAASQHVGAPYRPGGASPAGGFDCSGLVRYAYGKVGVNVPHSSLDQATSGRAIERDKLRRGDLLVFRDTYRPGPSHTGIFVGDGRFVHAADERAGVTVSRLTDAYWVAHYHGARRPSA